MSVARTNGPLDDGVSFGSRFDRRTVNISSALLSFFVVEALGLFCMGAYLLFR